MIPAILTNAGRLMALVLVQALVLDHLDVANGYMVPYLYVLFLLMLPFEGLQQMGIGNKEYYL